MNAKIKISEKEFYEKLCLDCGGQNGKECGCSPNCYREKAAKRFVEVIPEKTALEIWKDIGGYEGHYQISNLGNVKSVSRGSLQREIMLRPANNINGYRTVSLSKNNKSTTVKICRLVASAFIDNPENKRCVNHKDCDKHNDNVDNLEWVTHSENTVHAMKNGLQYIEYGENSRFAKLTKQQVSSIRSGLMNLKVEYIEQMASLFCVHKETIRKVLNFKTFNDYEQAIKELQDKLNEKNN